MKLSNDIFSQNGNDIEKAKDKAKTLDDVLAESVGKWGCFQVWFGIIIYLYESAYAPCVYGPMFTDFTPDHHCADGLANNTFDASVWEVEDNRSVGSNSVNSLCQYLLGNIVGKTSEDSDSVHSLWRK